MPYAAYVTIGRKQLPNVLTFEVTSSFVINEVYIVNNGAGNSTINVQDGNGVPVFPSLVLPAGGMLSLNSQNGVPSLAGFQWSSSASGCYGFVSGGHS